MKNNIKIIIADDHKLVRQTIAMAISNDPAFEVTAQAENGKDLINLLSQNSADIIILDLDMPVMNGLEALKIIKSKYPSIKVVILSMHFDSLRIKELVLKGVNGFMPKNCDFNTLINALHDIDSVGYYFSTDINLSLINELLATKSINPFFVNSKLSEKELQVLLMICTDKMPKEIADSLKVSERSVERYRATLYEKARAKTSAGLLLFALKNKLISINV